MAYRVAKVLHIRPNEILSTWCAPELIVAYGQFENERTYKNYKEWESLDKKMKKSVERPQQWAVKFVTTDDFYNNLLREGL